MAVAQRLSGSAEDLTQKLRELTENREKRGLALRPPKRLLRLLHLIKVQAATVAFRPISFANRTYLEERVEELHILGKELQSMIPELRPEWRSVCLQLCRLLEGISAENGKAAFSRIAWGCEQTRYREFWKDAAVTLPVFDTPLTRKKYERVIVVTGPGIGLGDEISSAEFIRSLRTSMPESRFAFYSFYPAFWSAVEADCEVHSLTANPTEAFDCVDAAIEKGDVDKLLVLFISFEGLHFHLAFCLEKIRPDVVEIAVGNGALWFNPADGNPIRHIETQEPLNPDNYDTLRQLAAVLTGSFEPKQTAARRLAPGLYKEAFHIILNPFTSKEIFLSPRDWFMIIQRALREASGKKPVSCTVLAGLSEQSAEYASQIVHEATRRSREHFDIGVLGDGAGTDPDSTFRNVFECMRNADLLIGIDTYTAHLAALLSVPSVSLCYERNVAFWPDAPNSMWIEIRHDFKTITELVALSFCLAGGLKTPEADKLKEKLQTERFIEVEQALNSADGNGEETADRIERITGFYDDAWSLLPAKYQTLISKLDYNCAWHRIGPWISSGASDEKSSLWLLKIAAKSHFRKILRMIANFGEGKYRYLDGSR